MAFGSELLMMAGLGFVVLGPKRMHTLLGQVAHLRADFEKASRNWKREIAVELEPGASTPDEHDSENEACRTCPQPSSQ